MTSECITATIIKDISLEGNILLSSSLSIFLISLPKLVAFMPFFHQKSKETASESSLMFEGTCSGRSKGLM